MKRSSLITTIESFAIALVAGAAILTAGAVTTPHAVGTSISADSTTTVTTTTATPAATPATDPGPW